ncbi:uncharacterized protein [Dermacentor albipictus]|uniref:uncharacterized protein n=1 Tax=Dermacentor albipictus TaxID=60249 RepID=UPI0038FC9180
MLENSSWVDNELRKSLKKKLEEMPLGIGYPETLLNRTALEARYLYGLSPDGENDLAEQTGLQTAFKAYLKACAEECANVTGDIREICHEKIPVFFLAYAQTKCRITDEAMREQGRGHLGYSHRPNK